MVTRKTWLSENFVHLEISESFLMGLQVSFSGDFSVLEFQLFCRRVSETLIRYFFIIRLVFKSPVIQS